MKLISGPRTDESSSGGHSQSSLAQTIQARLRSTAAAGSAAAGSTRPVSLDGRGRSKLGRSKMGRSNLSRSTKGQIETDHVWKLQAAFGYLNSPKRV
ncbi:hypothetical protein Rcae01_06033 [Novipirellula caenicola]|uniref:Uncharacterized protein n=1 Tax=Novipirellula caenicola TaxID=1536901 RepID=A0ABP9VZG4_9BACT